MSKKSKFIRHPNVEQFIASARKKTHPHMPHSVALLVLSPGGDQIATAVTKHAIDTGNRYVQSPPQLRMTEKRIIEISAFASPDAYKTVQGTALVLAKEFLNMTDIAEYNNQHFISISGKNAMKHNRLWYVGTTRGDDHRMNKRVPYGKFVHWVVMRSDRYRDVFRNDSIHYQSPQWNHVKNLIGLSESKIMSPRKLEMIDQVMLEYFQITGDYNKLVKAAQTRFQQIAA